MQYRLISLVLFLFLPYTITAANAESFNDGVKAYQRAEYDKALAIWKNQARQGNMVAQMLVGSMYAYGEGTKRDDREAVKWFRMSAESGYARAQFNLGVMYEKGWGVEKDLNSAMYWFRLAAAQGREDARKKLEKYNTLVSSEPARQTESTPDNTEKPAKKPVAGSEHIDIASKEKEIHPKQSTATESLQPVQKAPVQHVQAEKETAPVVSPVKENPPRTATTGMHKNERISLLIDTTPGRSHDDNSDTIKSEVTASRQAQHATDWLGRQNPDYYTIQLASNNSRMVLEEFIKNNHINNEYQIIVISRSNKTLYALVYGAYSDITMAQDAIRRLPGAWRQYVPWIREIRSLPQ